MTGEIKIRVGNLSKEFDVNFRKSEGALSRLLHIFRSRNNKKLKVLDDVSFDVNKEDIIGIIGRNGSGKSTLLRIMAGIFRPTKGNVSVYGDAIYLSGYGIGLQQKLTMKENIYLLGSIMGLSQKNIKSLFDQIVDFSGLKDFVNMRVCFFSSGMVSRLSFSVSANCINLKRPNILLLDEVFGSGGDLDFQKKAIEKMEELIGEGVTVVLVSHNLELVKKYCNKVIWLDEGKIKEIGKPAEVVLKYEKK